MKLSSILMLTLVLVSMGIFVGKYVEGEHTRFTLDADLISSKLDLPKSRINEMDFTVFENKFVLSTNKKLEFGKIEDTHSMEPTLWKGAYTIEMKIDDANSLKEGDIISFKSNSGSNIIHRIIKIDNDENGWYAQTKGDNNKRIDQELVRENQLIGVVVGVFG